MKHKSQNVTDEKNKIAQKKRQSDTARKEKDQSVLQGDMTTLQQGLGNQAVAQLMRSEEQEKADVKTQQADSFSSIISRQSQGNTPHIQRGLTTVNVQPAHPLPPVEEEVRGSAPKLGGGFHSAAAQPLKDANPDLGNSLDLETLKRVSPQFEDSKQKADRWSLIADVIGASAPVISGIITVASGGVGAAAAPIVGTVANGLTLLCKEMEKRNLLKEIDALLHVIKYVSADDPKQIFTLKARISEYEGKVGRIHVKEIKALVNIFIPLGEAGKVLGATEFLASTAYKKEIVNATKEAANANLSPSVLFEHLRDRDIQKQQAAGDYPPLDQMISQEDREREVSPAHNSLSMGQKAKKLLSGKKGTKVSPYG